MMEPTDDQGRDSAAADGSISSVLNSALKHINEFFMRLSEFSSSEDGQGTPISYSFCQSDAIKSGNGSKLTEAELNDVLGDIDAAHAAIVGVKAARFVTSLLNWPGVEVSEIKRSGA